MNWWKRLLGLRQEPAPTAEPPGGVEPVPEAEFQGGLHQDGVVWLAGQPSEAGLRWAAAQGARLVITLRTLEEIGQEVGYDEEGVARELGLAFLHVPVSGPDKIAEADAARITAALEAAGGPVLLHCRSGARARAMLQQSRQARA